MKTTCIILLLYTINLSATDSIPLRLSDTIIFTWEWSSDYDTLLVEYDSLGREVKTSFISLIDDDYHNSWFCYTTQYDSNNREIGGFSYGISPPKNAIPFYWADTLIGKLDTIKVQNRYCGDTTITTYQYLNHFSKYQEYKSYNIKNSKGQIIEETELNDIGKRKKQKFIFRDSTRGLRVEVTSYYKKTGILKHIETDSIFCDSILRINSIKKSTTRNSATVRNNRKYSKSNYSIDYECENCNIEYRYDSRDSLYSITKYNEVGDTLVFKQFTYDDSSKSCLIKLPSGDEEKYLYKYNKYGHLIEFEKSINGNIRSHYKYIITYQ